VLFVNYFNRFRPPMAGLCRGGGPIPDTPGGSRSSSTCAIGPASPCPFPRWRASECSPALNSRCDTTSLGARKSTAPPPGYSFRPGNQALEEVFAQSMPPEMGSITSHVVSGKEGQKASSPWQFSVFRCSFVFLILAATLESWSLPFSCSSGTPIAVFWRLRRLDGPAHGEQRTPRLGSSCSIGLAAKECQSSSSSLPARVREGKNADGCRADRPRIRLRPILMIFPGLRLWMYSSVDRPGAGERPRRILGTVVSAVCSPPRASPSSDSCDFLCGGRHLPAFQEASRADARGRSGEMTRSLWRRVCDSWCFHRAY